jgi:hypothetical protein
MPGTVMVKRVLLIIGAVVAAVAVYLGFELGVLMGAWQPILRPRGVSPKAHYVSLDGKWTTWFDCSADSIRNVDHCRAWDDRGRLLLDGDFRLDAEKRMATESELRPTRVLFYNGEVYRICVAASTGDCARFLVPVKGDPR